MKELGCAGCGIDESGAVFEMEIGIFCDPCHTVRRNILEAIMRALRKEPLVELIKMRSLLEIDKG